MCHQDVLYSLVFLYTVQKLLCAASPAVDPWRPPRRSPVGGGTANDLDIPATPPAVPTAGSGQERVGLTQPARVPAADSHALPRAGGLPFTGAARLLPPCSTSPARPFEAPVNGRVARSPRPGRVAHTGAVGESGPGPAAREVGETGAGTATARQIDC